MIHHFTSLKILMEEVNDRKFELGDVGKKIILSNLNE